MKIRLLVILTLVICQGLMAIACSDEPQNNSSNGGAIPTIPDIPGLPTPDELDEQGFAAPEMPRVTAEYLKQMMDDDKTDFLVVAAQFPMAFDGGHLPGAVNIPGMPVPPQFPEEKINEELHNLPKNKLIIFYCDCPDDAEAAMLAKRMLDLETGHDPNKIIILWKGYYGWLEHGFPTEETPRLDY